METTAIKSTGNYKRVYIWQLVVRFFHWINAFCIIILIATGLVIANPPAIMSQKEASQQFLFGYVRLVHFTAAYIMVAVMIMRVYWAFAGNKFANWRTFFPFSKKGFNKMWHVIKYDIFLQNEEVYDFKNVSTGHNTMAAVSYLIMFVVALVMVFTGFALYADNANWFFPKFFQWVVNLFTTDEMLIRHIHHVSMWLFVLFIIIHVYLVFYHDWLEGRGESSSMISGYKFVRSEQLGKENEPEMTEKNKESNSELN